MTDLTHGKQSSLPCMAGECGTTKVTVADKRPVAAHHGIPQAPFSRGSWGLR